MKAFEVCLGADHGLERSSACASAFHLFPSIVEQPPLDAFGNLAGRPIPSDSGK
jgi:hypothetical protein